MPIEAAEKSSAIEITRLIQGHARRRFTPIPGAEVVENGLSPARTRWCQLEHVTAPSSYACTIQIAYLIEHYTGEWVPAVVPSREAVEDAFRPSPTGRR